MYISNLAKLMLIKQLLQIIKILQIKGARPDMPKCYTDSPSPLLLDNREVESVEAIYCDPIFSEPDHRAFA